MNKIYNLIGLAARARKISTGETLIYEIRNKKVSFVLIAKDASENSIKKITDKCSFYQVPYAIYGTIDELSDAIGKNNRVAIGLLDQGFSKKIKELIGG